MLSDKERAALIRTLVDASERIGNSAALLEIRDMDRGTASLLRSAVTKIERAIDRIALSTKTMNASAGRK
jgi:hypothetical protein